MKEEDSVSLLARVLIERGLKTMPEAMFDVCKRDYKIPKKRLFERIYEIQDLRCKRKNRKPKVGPSLLKRRERWTIELFHLALDKMCFRRGRHGHHVSIVIGNPCDTSSRAEQGFHRFGRMGYKRIVISYHTFQVPINWKSVVHDPGISILLNHLILDA